MFDFYKEKMSVSRETFFIFGFQINYNYAMFLMNLFSKWLIFYSCF